MQEKLKQVELLAGQLIARQEELAAQNATLKNRLRVLEDHLASLKATEAELRNLKEWKKNTQTTLRRLAAKVDKELTKAQGN